MEYIVFLTFIWTFGIAFTCLLMAIGFLVLTEIEQYMKPVTSLFYKVCIGFSIFLAYITIFGVKMP